MAEVKCELFNDNFQNFKRYNVPKAQLVIADIPYNLGANAYASNPMWYEGGIILTENQNTLVNNSLILMAILRLLNISIFAIVY